MRQIFVSFLFLAFAFPLAADEKKDAATKLNGTYEVLSVLADGKPDNDKKDNITFVFKDGTIVIKDAGKNRDENATFTLDPSQKPAHIDIQPKNGPKTIAGIYELKETDKGTELTLAFAKEGERPKDFKGEGKDSMVAKLFKKKAQ